jgi:putative membrane protein
MLALPLLGWVVVGCSPQGSEAAERGVDSAGRRDSIAAVAASTMSEGQVLGLLAATHAADSALGTLGAERAASLDVKEFARMIMREHHALRLEAFDAAKQQGLAVESPQVPPDAPPAGALRELMRTPAGAAWDRAYVDFVLTAHESAFENTARALAAARQAPTRQLIERAVPILQKHVDKAESLAAALNKQRADTLPKRDTARAAKQGAPIIK